jgi:hypothetical protein
MGQRWHRRAVLGWLSAFWGVSSWGSAAAQDGGVVDPRQFGAVGDGLVDDSFALAAALDYAIGRRISLVLRGRYRISRPLQAYGPPRAGGALHLVCEGVVSIEVDPQAAPFGDVLYFHTEAVCDCSIRGGSLTIDGAHRAGRGLTVRHNGEAGGSVRITSPLVLRNFNERAEREVRENHALAVIGDFQQVEIHGSRVESVRRTNMGGGASKGISVSGFSGTVLIRDAWVQDVRVPGIGSYDADGIAVFSRRAGALYAARSGRAIVQACTFVDCQGRSLKSQCSDTDVIDPIVRRSQAVSIAHSVEFDFQMGNGRVVNPTYDYRRNGGCSPLGVSHSCIAFQQNLGDQPMRSQALGGVLHTEVPVPRYVALIHRPVSRSSETVVDQLQVSSGDGLDGSAFSRAVIELGVDHVAAMGQLVRVRAVGIVGPLLCPIVGYTDLKERSTVPALQVEVVGCKNILAADRRNPTLANLSGGRIPCPPGYQGRDNVGFDPPMMDCPRSDGPVGAGRPRGHANSDSAPVSSAGR